MKLQEEILFFGELLPDNALPTEVVLFGPGVTETKKGPFLFDAEAARAVMAQFANAGVDRLPFDIGHGMIQPTSPDSHKAMGWFVPEAREIVAGEGPSLLATDIQWTDSAADALKAREFRFFSPAILFDGDTRRIQVLRNVALTNIPATKGQKPLVLSDDGETENQIQEPKMQVLLDSLEASDEAGAVAALNKVKSFQSAVLSATGAEDYESALSAIKLSQETAIKAQAELSELTRERAVEKRGAAIEALLSDNKLLPAQKDFAASLSEEHFEQFSATLSAIPALTQKIEAPEGGSKDVKTDGADFDASELLGDC